jgi:hypothetical protein
MAPFHIEHDLGSAVLQRHSDPFMLTPDPSQPKVAEVQGAYSTHHQPRSVDSAAALGLFPGAGVARGFHVFYLRVDRFIGDTNEEIAGVEIWYCVSVSIHNDTLTNK